MWKLEFRGQKTVRVADTRLLVPIVCGLGNSAQVLWDRSMPNLNSHYMHICIYVGTYVCVYRMSQEECARLRESVPYVKLYRHNPKHLYPKLSGYGDNGQWSLKLCQLLHTYWLPNTYWNWQEYVVSVMLIAVRNIKVTCEWHKPLNWTTKTLSLVS